MKLIMEQSDLQGAVQEYLKSVGVTLPVNEVSFTNTASGVVVEVHIGKAGEPGAIPAGPITRRRRTKAEIAADEAAAAAGNTPAPSFGQEESEEEEDDAFESDANEEADATEDMATTATPVVDGGKSLFG